MNIALINQFYPPARAPTGELLRDLARALAARGHAVTVLTSRGGYGGGSSGEKVSDPGVIVRRFGPARAHGTGLEAKVLDYARFHLRLAFELRRLRPPPDAVVCQTTPPLAGATAARFARRRGARFILWCMDLYPEALAANGWPREGSALYRLLSRAAAFERENAEAVITLGPDMTERLRAATPAAVIDEIPVWSRMSAAEADRAAARALRRARGWAERDIVLLYSGNMGRAHRAEEFAALAQRCAEGRPRVRVVFCGTGPRQLEWHRAWPLLFEWLDPVAETELIPHLLSADVHLISQQPAWLGVVTPSKYQAACALGRPVIFAGPESAAVARWIAEGDTGWRLPPDDPEAVAFVAAELRDTARVARKGENAAAQSRRLFDRRALLGRLIARIESSVSASEAGTVQSKPAL